MENKKRYCRIHALYSLDLAPIDFAFFPQLKLDLHGKRFSDLDELHTESDLKKEMVWRYLRKMGFDDTGNAYSTRESILRNCAVHRIDNVILL